jgi:hypothetical protein
LKFEVLSALSTDAQPRIWPCICQEMGKGKQVQWSSYRHTEYEKHRQLPALHGGLHRDPARLTALGFATTTALTRMRPRVLRGALGPGYAVVVAELQKTLRSPHPHTAGYLQWGHRVSGITEPGGWSGVDVRCARGAIASSGCEWERRCRPEPGSTTQGSSRAFRILSVPLL